MAAGESSTIGKLGQVAGSIFSWLGDNIVKPVATGISEGVSNFSREGLPVFTENLLARGEFEPLAQGTVRTAATTPAGARNAATYSANLGVTDQLVIVAAAGLLIFALVRT